jgi:alpha-ketoglutarate-dependent taurine dioxygenase
LNNPFHVACVSDPPQGSPFSLQNDAAYQRWREAKLSAYPISTKDLVVEVDNPLALTEAEVDAMLNVCRKTNMVIYAARTGREDKENPRAVGDRFGLRRLDSNMLADDDGITSLHVVPGKSQRGYIPYSNKRLLWHTDGYYHGTDSRIAAFVLHCVSPAAEGGQNSLLDHEIAYILMRDANPDHVRALMEPNVMTIPPNMEAGMETRAAVTGPVFSIDPVGGNLHMRYTARTRSIEWKTDTLTQEAVKFLEHLLAGESPYMFRHTLGANQGLLCNNVLHNRTAFTDDAERGMARLVYRARYHDRIRGTQFNEIYG